MTSQHMTSNRIKFIARDLDAKRIWEFIADNKSLWKLELEAEKTITLCKNIQISMRDLMKFYE